MPDRGFSAGGQYRYGFNGKESDNEVRGGGNELDYGMRTYDSRLGKFLSNDPLSHEYPWYSPYQFAGNTPIQATDLDGFEPKGFHFDNPYSKLHDGTSVEFIASAYDGKVFDLTNEPRISTSMVSVYAIRDIDQKNYLIYQSATGAKKEYWYREYDAKGFLGDVNSFKWNTPPDPSPALYVLAVAPIVVLPGALEYGGGLIYKVYKELRNRQNLEKNRDLIEKGQALERNSLSRAGRALQKHSSREGTSYNQPPNGTKAIDYNKAAQEELREIIDATNRVDKLNKKGGIDYINPGTGKGARYTKEGEFETFLEPSKPKI